MHEKTREVNGMQVVDALLSKQGVIKPDEVWIHGMWGFGKLLHCLKAKMKGKKVVRMTHGSLSPVYLERQSKWKKRLFGWFIERPAFRFLTDRVVVTGPWEEKWCRDWGVTTPIEVIDLKQFFKFDLTAVSKNREGIKGLGKDKPLKVLYLGRIHPLKGTDALRAAVDSLKAEGMMLDLREVGDHFDEELESDWAWADVLVLPTLSENFGLVVAEALERGKPVITTDGAPAWHDLKPTQGCYLKGYRQGTDATRIRLLKDALIEFLG